MKFLVILLILAGCATSPRTPVKEEPTFDQQRRKEMEDCVIKLLNQGIHEQLVYPICKDIHARRQLLQQVR